MSKSLRFLSKVLPSDVRTPARLSSPACSLGGCCGGRRLDGAEGQGRGGEQGGYTCASWGSLPSGAPVAPVISFSVRDPRSGCTVVVDFSHGSDPQARPGGLGGRQRRPHAALRRAGRSAADAAHADRRRRAARGLPLPPGGGRRAERRPGPAGDAAGRPRAVLRPAPRLLARRAPGRRRGDRPTSWSTARCPSSNRSLGMEHWVDEVLPEAIEAVQRALRRPAGAPRRLEPGRHLRAPHRRRPAGPAHRVADRRRLARST